MQQGDAHSGLGFKRGLRSPSQRTVRTGYTMHEPADNGVVLMVAARDALKSERWNDADRHLVELQRLIHGLRIAIRDERLPLSAPQVVSDWQGPS